MLLEGAAGDQPARTESRRVEPAVVVPARDVRRVEELLPRHRVQPDPVLGRDAVATDPQQAGRVDDRRLRHPRSLVEERVLEDRGHHGADVVPRAHVQPLKSGPGRVVRRHGDEVAPELVHEEGCVVLVGDAQPDRALPVEGADLPEDHLHGVVVVFALEAEALPAVAVLVVGGPAGQRAGLLADVALRVAVVGAEREELHQLAGVVLVRSALHRVEAVQVEQHRRVDRHAHGKTLERAEPDLAEEVVLLEHDALVADGLVRGREPVVPDEGHPLDQRLRGAHHAVEPPEMVVAEGVLRRDPVSVHRRRLADEPVDPVRVDERVDCAVKALRRQRVLLAAARPEAGAPEESLGLRWPERPLVDAQRHESLIGS